LATQRLVGDPFGSISEGVRSLLAVQSQDYAGAKWGLGQRVSGATDADLDRAFDAGALIRTHVLRPTWHFVAPEDLRWLQALTSPRIHQASGYQYRSNEIDTALAARAAAVFERELAGGQAKTREELGRALGEAGIAAAGLRQTYLVMHAELETIICSGPRRGKRQTYALVEERVPPSRPRSRDEALAELAQRYVEGHGPAQAIDLAWWSGLTLGDARIGLDLASPPLQRETIDGRVFFVSPAWPGLVAPMDNNPPIVHLLPNYDELLIAFRDRTDAMDPDLPPPARIAAEILNHVIVRNGLGVGGWRRADDGRRARVDLNPLVPLSEADRQALRAAVDRLSTFLGRPVETTGLD
jgi:hypothetical protein